jgi:hypothetical protein
MWLSHDATLLRYELVIADENELPEAVLEERVADRLAGTFKRAVDNLIGCGFAKRESRIEASNLEASNLEASNRSFYIRALEASSSRSVHPETLKTSTSKSLEASNARSLFIRRAVDRRNFNSDYQAVVAGTKPRRDPLQQFAATLSRSNAADFFEGVSGLDDKQLADLKRRATRAVARSRRN